MEKRGLKIYFIHSAKSDFNKNIYLPVLRSRVLANHTLVFPDSEVKKDIIKILWRKLMFLSLS